MFRRQLRNPILQNKLAFIRYNSNAKQKRLVRGLSNLFDRPNRIILVRHGQSLGNVDEHEYVVTPDWKIPLSKKGREQAFDAGLKLNTLIGEKGKVFFYVSPYVRTRETLQGILESFRKSQVIGIREEPRIVEQQFGNFQNYDDVKKAKIDRSSFGRFFYRFPNGESGLDVYNRVTSFISTLFRDALQLRAKMGGLENVNLVIVTHGLTLRLFLMRWFQYNVVEFESTKNPGNADVVVMERSHAESGVQYFKPCEDAMKSMSFPRWERSTAGGLERKYSFGKCD